MTAAEKILILLSLCEHWSWCRPGKRVLEPSAIETAGIMSAAVVTLCFDDQEAQFTYGYGLNDLDKYRLVLKAISQLDVPLPDFAYEDLEFMAIT